MKQNFKKERWTGIGFFNLEPDTKYCLVDTMVVLPMRRGDADVMMDVKRELRGATLILLHRILGEAAHKHSELKDGDGMTDPEDFASSVYNQLKSAGIKFESVWLERTMSASVDEMFKRGAHAGLSKADYALLVAAMKRPDMDVMTEDVHLIDSINAERGPKAKGKIIRGRTTYCGRRWATAVFIKRKLDGYVLEDARMKWRDLPQCTVFLVGDAKIASIDHSLEGNAHVDLSPLTKGQDKKKLKFQHKLEVEIREFFSQWKLKKNRKKSGSESAQPKDWYMQRRDDIDEIEGLGAVEKRNLSCKLRKKNIGDCAF